MTPTIDHIHSLAIHEGAQQGDTEEGEGWVSITVTLPGRCREERERIKIALESVRPIGIDYRVAFRHLGVDYSIKSLPLYGAFQFSKADLAPRRQDDAVDAALYAWEALRKYHERLLLPPHDYMCRCVVAPIYVPWRLG